jgi:hypothetical protein
MADSRSAAPRLYQAEVQLGAITLRDDSDDGEAVARSLLTATPAADGWRPRTVGDYPGVTPEIDRLLDVAEWRHVPAFSDRAVDALGDLLRVDGELLPVMHPTRGRMHLFNVLAVVDAFDLARSDYQAQVYLRHRDVTAWNVRRFEIKPGAERLIAGHHLFRMEYVRESTRFASEALVERARAAGLTGLVASPVWPDIAYPIAEQWKARDAAKRAHGVTPRDRNPGPFAPPAAPPVIREVPPTIQDELRVAAEQGRDLLALAGHDLSALERDPRDLVFAIDRLARSAAWADEEELFDHAIGLGTLWADQLVRSTGWRWVEAPYPSGEHCCVVSPDASLILHPTLTTRVTLEAPRRTSALLRLYLDLAGGVHVAPPGALRRIGTPVR